MKNKAMQCKDIPDKPILDFLLDRRSRNLGWCCWMPGFENSITPAMPPDLPEKLVISKMGRLIKRGLVGGCPCGCRGDYEITDKGVEELIYLRAKEITNGLPGTT